MTWGPCSHPDIRFAGSFQDAEDGRVCASRRPSVTAAGPLPTPGELGVEIART